MNTTNCRRAAATICPRPSPPPWAPKRRADGKVAAVSHGQHVPTPTAAAAWRANTVVSKAVWWPWLLTLKVVPSHVWRGLPLSQFWSSYRPLCSRLRPDVRDLRERQSDVRLSVRQRDVRQHHRLMPPPRGRAGHNNGQTKLSSNSAVSTLNTDCGESLQSVVAVQSNRRETVHFQLTNSMLHINGQ